MRREQAIYARCEVKAPPTLRAAVLKKIEEEEPAHARAPFEALHGWLVSTLGGRQLRRRVAFAAGLILLGSVAWLLFGGPRRGAVTPERAEAVADGGSTTVPASRGADDAPRSERSQQDSVRREPGRVVAQRSEGRRGRASGWAAPGATVAGRAGRKPTGYGRMPSEALSVVAVASPAVAGQRQLSTAEIDDETARHFERARMLLRSFKNGRLSEGDPTLDIAYERRLSRALLGKNNILRGDARADGRQAVEMMLSRLEPFLLEIANLGEGATPEEVRSIKERMQSEGIIARLSLF